ncbi:MAG: LytTR family DNA-binding domain-containing protein [Pseudomonadota bacterium]
MLRLLFASTLVLVLHTAHAFAETLVFAERSTARVCSAGPEMVKPPSPQSAVCRMPTPDMPLDRDKLYWVLADVIVPEELTSNGEPLGVSVLGRGSRRIYLDGTLIGVSGQPSSLPDGEIGGAMDSVHLIPERLSGPGRKQVAVLISGHRNLLPTYEAPVFIISVYRHPRDLQLSLYIAAIAAFGAFLSAAVYFGSSSIAGRARIDNGLLAALCAVAGAQLMAEVSRGVWAYPYWFHDIRLALVWGAQFTFAAILLLLTIRKFPPPRPYLVGAVGALLCVLSPLGAEGADEMVLRLTLISSVYALAIVLFAMWQKKTSSIPFALGLGVYALVSLLMAGLFLDVFQFVATAVIIGVLLVLQAQDNARVAEELTDVQERAYRLEQALAEAHADDETPLIELKVGRSVEPISVQAIVHCAAAGDYVEVTMREGQTILASTSLSKLEEVLPRSFLRIHRSHLINTADVKSLIPEENGKGKVEMSNGVRVPVSRRLLPMVRNRI